MGFYPDVRPGQPFRPNALLDNDVRHLLNGLNGFIPGKFEPRSSGGPAELLTYPCRNMTEHTIEAGSAVAFDLTHVAAGRILLVTPAKDYLLQWGVLMSELAPGAEGRVAVSGCLLVTVTGGSGDYVGPDYDNPGTLIRSIYGEPIIGIVDEEKMIVRLTGVKPYYDEWTPFHAYFDVDYKLICNGGTWYRLELYGGSDTEKPTLTVVRRAVDAQNFGTLSKDVYKYIVFSPDESQIVLRDDTETGDIVLATYDHGGVRNNDIGVIITSRNS